MTKYLLFAAIVYELTCYGNTSNGIETKSWPLFWDGKTVYTLDLQPDFMEGLQNGFCLLGPVDPAMRQDQQRELIEEYLRHLK